MNYCEKCGTDMALYTKHVCLVPREGTPQETIVQLRADLAQARADLFAYRELKRNKCEQHQGARVECGQCYGSLKRHYDNVVAQRDALAEKCELLYKQETLLLAERDAARDAQAKTAADNLALHRQIDALAEQVKGLEEMNGANFDTALRQDVKLDDACDNLSAAQGEFARLMTERNAALARVEELERLLRASDPTNRSVLDAEYLAIAAKLERAEEWHRVAMRLGEEITNSGPDGYYDMTPGEWLSWGLSAVRYIRKTDFASTANQSTEATGVDGTRAQTVGRAVDNTARADIAGIKPGVASVVPAPPAADERSGDAVDPTIWPKLTALVEKFPKHVETAETSEPDFLDADAQPAVEAKCVEYDEGRPCSECEDAKDERCKAAAPSDCTCQVHCGDAHRCGWCGDFADMDFCSDACAEKHSAKAGEGER